MRNVVQLVVPDESRQISYPIPYVILRDEEEVVELFAIGDGYPDGVQSDTTRPRLVFPKRGGYSADYAYYYRQ